MVSLKHGADKSENQLEFGSKRERNVFNSATPMVAGTSNSSASTVKSSPDVGPSCSQTDGSSGRRKANKSRKDGIQPQDASVTDKPKENMSELSVSETTTDTSEQCPVKNEKLKRKGDLEFEMQLKMALAATAIGSSTSDAEASIVVEPSSTSAILTPPSKRMKKIIKDEPGTSSSGISTAIGSKKVGAPLYWAEVFCSGENLTGKWVHVDAINAVIDGEDKVEAAAAACRKSLRYVVAFAGNGAKDVTRRSKIFHVFIALVF